MNIFRKVPHWPSLLLVLSLTIIPIILLQPTINATTFTNTALLFTTIGQMCGVAGASLFAINFILTTRLKFLENYFKGLNHVYLYHHNTGAIGFILLLLHPFFLALPLLSISFKSFLLFFIPPILAGWPQWMGEIAIWILIVLLTLTFFVKLPYEFWKKTHKYLGVALPFVFLHIAFIPGVISTIPFLYWYMLTLIGLAMCAYTYKTLFGKILIRKHKYHVSSVINKGNSTIEVVMKPQEKPIHYDAGQFIYITVSKSKSIKKEEHPFSITSAPSSSTLSFAAKILGDFTESLKTIKKGNEVLVEGPYGKFLFDIPNQKQIWIAGGIGVTPFLSMARSFIDNTTSLSFPRRRATVPFMGESIQIDVILYYIVSTPDEAIYLKELQDIQKKVPNFTVIPYFSKTQGRISSEVIAQNVKDLKDRDIFLCGPIPMMQSLRSQFKALGIKSSAIHSEEFQLI